MYIYRPIGAKQVEAYGGDLTNSGQGERNRSENGNIRGREAEGEADWKGGGSGYSLQL